MKYRSRSRGKVKEVHEGLRELTSCAEEGEMSGTAFSLFPIFGDGRGGPLVLREKFSSGES